MTIPLTTDFFEGELITDASFKPFTDSELAGADISTHAEIDALTAEIDSLDSELKFLDSQNFPSVRLWPEP